jgi:hypothetical protein
MGPIADLEQTMAQLDTTMDTVDELLRELPISDFNKLELVNKVYEFWRAVEIIVEMELSVDNTD